MPNGKPGDHPLTDLLLLHLPVYGEEADALIREISTLCSTRELDDWWYKEIWSDDPDDQALVLQKARSRRDELLERARENGWERP